MENKILKKLTVLVLAICSIVCFSIAALQSGVIKDFSFVAYAQEISTTPTAQGTCGTSATWEYYADTATLEIKGSGTISSRSWGGYSSKIRKLTVSNGITSISKGTFNELSALKEVSLPFVGESRTATGPSGTFGYIFGYVSEATVYNTSSSASAKYVYNGTTGASVGYVKYKYQESYYHPGGASISDLGWTSSSGYRTTSSTEFMNYYVSGAPSGTIWQYSCNNAYWHPQGGDQYTLASYYYYIPSTLSVVTITDASQISTAAFMNCTNITEINLNDEITSVGDYAFRDCTNLDTFTYLLVGIVK